MNAVGAGRRGVSAVHSMITAAGRRIVIAPQPDERWHALPCPGSQPSSTRAIAPLITTIAQATCEDTGTTSWPHHAPSGKALLEFLAGRRASAHWV